MQLIEFPEQTTVIAKDQPEYIPLPAYLTFNDKGEIVCCWGLTMRERIRVIFTGRIWHHVLTFSQPLQPQRLSTFKPAMPKHETLADAAISRARVRGRKG